MDKVNTFHFECFLLHDVGNNVMEYVVSSHNKCRHITLEWKYWKIRFYNNKNV